jgi:Protein of unknown function (DUF2905)
MNLPRLLIFAGLALVALGILASVVNRLNLPLGRLPGDIVWRGRNSTVYIPLVTCLLLSLLGSLILWLVNRR